MVNVIFKGPLATYFGTEKITIDKPYSSIIELLKEIDSKKIIVDNGKIKPGFIILVNGKDYRLLNGKLDINSTIEIIPINHGG